MIDGKEKLRWYFGSEAPRPCFFPITGPSGIPLTRMGHPGAPNHDHHRSVWFAHHKVLGIDFWSNQSDAFIRQDEWLSFEDGDDAARMAARLGWYDGHDPQPLIKQDVVFSVSSDGNDGVLLEIQSMMWSVAETLELGQTNFGLLAVRVAKSISAVFGDGVITGAGGQQTESKLFGKPSAWIDYSGSVEDGVTEGITYFDHRDNGSYPSKWHVRDDGWMGASVCRDGPVMLHQARPTTWRYLLHAHGGGVNVPSANRLATRFNETSSFDVKPDGRPHHHARIGRTTPAVDGTNVLP